jgi:hypothetical protein
MATTPTTQADRIARSLKRLGFRMSRTGPLVYRNRHRW